MPSPSATANSALSGSDVATSRTPVRRSTRVASRPPPPPEPPVEVRRGPAKRPRRRPKKVVRESTPPPPRHGIIFPTEVWKLVFQELYKEVGRQGFVPVVGFLSALRREAECVLYQEVRIVTIASALSFVDSIMDNPHRANVVRELSIRTPMPNADVYVQAIRAALDKLPGLISIDLCRGRAFRKTKPVTLSSILQGKTLKALRSLKGEPCFLDALFAQFLKAHQSQLEEVGMYTAVAQSDVLAAASDEHKALRFPKLRALACDRVILDHIGRAQNITHLWLVDEFDYTRVRNTIELFGPQLVSLRVEPIFRSSDSQSTHARYNFLHWESCTRLKYLQITVPISRSELPPNLETLVWLPFEPNATPTPDDRPTVRNYLQSVLGFRRLKEVVCHMGEEGVFHFFRSPEGDIMQARADPTQFNENTWACV